MPAPSWSCLISFHFGCWISFYHTSISLFSAKDLPQQWITESQNALIWKGSRTIIKTPGSTRDKMGVKPQIWKCCPNTSCVPVPWGCASYPGQPVPCPLPSGAVLFPDVQPKQSCPLWAVQSLCCVRNTAGCLSWDTRRQRLLCSPSLQNPLAKPPCFLVPQ